MKTKIITALIVIILLATGIYYLLVQKKYIQCNRGFSSPEIFSWDRNHIYSYFELDIKNVFETYKIIKKDKKEIRGMRLKKDGFDFGAFTGNLILIDRIEGEVLLGNDLTNIKENYNYYFFDCVKISKNSLIIKPKF